MKKKDICWHVYGSEKVYGDEEFIRLICEGIIRPEDLVTNRDLRVWLPLKETVYAFYLPVRD